MNNLIFSLNATVPVFLMMVFGWFVHRIKLLDDNATSQVNRFVFRALLPALLFMDLSTADFRAVWDGKFVLFCMCVTVLSVGIAVIYSMICGKGHERGEIIQASYRSSAAILGIAFVNNIYGHSTMAALMIVGTVPLYNIIAVTTLAVTSPDTDKAKDRASLVKSTVKSIVTNPIILGIVVGIGWSLLKIPQPVILSKSVTYLGNMATPLSLISLGASFRFNDAKGKFRVTLGIACIKLVLFCSIFLPIAIKLGFRGEKLIAILVMLGSATTSSCFVMAKNFGHKGIITAFAVMLTTLCSAFTLTGWLFILKTLNYI
ncbi:MAG: AEC family transporter [Ruminococcus sp.]|nr:AEC family transporter [Ruminococcus sp.]MCR5599545.1 AEC family transporter [Ruminococcus sp.]